MKILLSLFLVVSLQAKTILISDIDDTIKVGHIRSKLGTILNAFNTKNIFLGMADLYKAVESDADAKIFYLTNAPVKIMRRSHTKLIENGNFPQAPILFRPSGVSSNDHKNIALDMLMKRERPDTVILVGDNGEHDIHFYNNIAMKYPTIEFKTYIRVAYDLDPKSRPLPTQQGFVTPFEIATSLHEDGLLDLDTTEELFRKGGPVFLSDKKDKRAGPMYLPKWLGCKGHKLNASMRNASFIYAQSIENRINSVCRN